MVRFFKHIFEGKNISRPNTKLYLTLPNRNRFNPYENDIKKTYHKYFPNINKLNEALFVLLIRAISSREVDQPFKTAEYPIKTNIKLPY